MKKRRLSFRLDADEAAVIAPVDFWNQLHDHCRETAKEFPDQSEGWIEAADHIMDWIEKTRDKRVQHGS